MKRSALALATTARAPARPASPALELLRRRLARAGVVGHRAVLVDFLEDDLEQARGALEAVAEHLAAVETALRHPRAGRSALLDLALDREPERRLEELLRTTASLGRRLAEVSRRLD